MNISKILVAGAFATSLAFAQEDAWPADEQTEEQVAEQETETQAEPAEAAEPQAEEQTAEAPEASKQEAPAAAPAPRNRLANSQVNEPASNDNINDNYAQAQPASLNSKAGIGIHGMFDYSFLHGLPEDWMGGDDEEAPAGIGFVAGIRARLPMSPVVHFTPEVNIHMATLVQKDEIGKRTFKQVDLEVPFMARGILLDWFYVGAGIQVSLSLSSKVTLDAGEVSPGGGLESQPFEYEEQIDQNGFGLGIVFGVGGFIMERLSIDLRVVMGLTDTYEVDPEKNELINSMEGGKQMSFRGGIGFWFM